MGTLHTFHPRPTAPVVPPPSPAGVRAQIEEAAQTALDTADALLAILDRTDGDTDAEDGRDAEPSLERFRFGLIRLIGVHASASV